MTELEMLEAEKYWCENCCNWDKEQVQMDGYAKCKLTGTLSFGQESGRECKCFNVPAENVIVPPCKVGDTVWCIVKDLDEVLEGRVRRFTVYEGVMNVYCGINGYYEQVYTNDEFEKMAFSAKEEAEKALGGAKG